jgi:hypothetical protein
MSTPPEDPLLRRLEEIPTPELDPHFEEGVRRRAGAAFVGAARPGGGWRRLWALAQAHGVPALLLASGLLYAVGAIDEIAQAFAHPAARSRPAVSIALGAATIDRSSATPVRFRHVDRGSTLHDPQGASSARSPRTSARDRTRAGARPLPRVVGAQRAHPRDDRSVCRRRVRRARRGPLRRDGHRRRG